MLYRLRCLRTYVSTRQARIQNDVLRILMQRQSAFGNPIPAGGGVCVRRLARLPPTLGREAHYVITLRLARLYCRIVFLYRHRIIFLVPLSDCIFGTAA